MPTIPGTYRSYSKSGNERYWATAPDDEIADEIEHKVKAYLDYVDQTGRGFLWRKAYQLYYGMDGDLGWSNSAAVTYGGAQGELALVRVNLFRSFIEDLLMLAASERPTFVARAVNSDYDTQAEVELAESLVRYYLAERGFERLFDEAAENALLYGEGWVYVGWDPEEGESYAVDPEGDRVVKSGDVVVRVFDPLYVARDIGAEPRDQAWHVITRRENKWDLVARFPKFREHILGGKIAYDLRSSTYHRSVGRETEDEILVRELFHKRTDALPEGRYVLSVGDVVLVSDGLPYREYPLHAMMPTPEKHSSFGYSRCWDLMALQEGVDAVVSNIITAHDAFGLPNVWTQKGSDLTVTDIVGGLNHLESDDKPEILDFFQSIRGHIDLYELLGSIMQELVGLNNIVRGKSEANVRTEGQAALLAGRAAQSNGRLQEAWVRLNKDAATMLISVLQMHAKAPHIVEIAGKDTIPYAREFTHSDISRIQKVTVELNSPIQRTLEGKVEIASQLVALANTRHAVEPITPSQFMDVVLSGRLKPISDLPLAQKRLVQQENELMMRGEVPPVMLTDFHADHIREHSIPLANPSIRSDPAIMEAHMAHIQWHIDSYATADPNILSATGQQPPMVPPPVAGAMAGGAPPGEGVPPPPGDGINPGVGVVPDDGGMPPAPPPAPPPEVPPA